MNRLAIVLVALLCQAAPAVAQQTPSARDILWDQLKSGEADCPAPRSAGLVELDYPPASMRAREEGRVVVGLCVGADGTPETVEILSAPDIPRLKIATALWACGRRLEPDVGADGTPVRSCARAAEFTWRLTDFPRWAELLEQSDKDLPVTVRTVAGK